MKKFVITLLTALVSFGFAQFTDNGVTITTDEFTGETECQQVILDGDLAFSMLAVDSLPDTVIWRVVVIVEDIRDLPYGLWGEFPGDFALVKLGEEELHQLDFLVVADAEVANGMMVQVVSFPMEISFIEHIVRYPGPVRVRLDGSEGIFDFTFSEAARASFASQFFLDCVSADFDS